MEVIFIMENFDRDSLREIYEKERKNKAEKRGSLFITIIIIMIFAFGGIFYVKTAKPLLFEKAVSCITQMKQKTLETISDGLTEKITDEQKAPTGDMLRSGDTLLKTDDYEKV